MIQSLEPLGQDQLVFATYQPVPSLPFLLAEPEFAVTAAAWGAPEISAGPYKLMRESDDRILLELRENPDPEVRRGGSRPHSILRCGDWRFM